jgi:hypothetical protein
VTFADAGGQVSAELHKKLAIAGALQVHEKRVVGDEALVSRFLAVTEVGLLGAEVVRYSSVRVVNSSADSVL